ncbi:hypothetical protein N802_00700 [Knoellia sinensis KCTC 19936]|uniref:Uncharacterized protein n=1 Tax=Knoellia sinensis KCTC 19936 TaxID=1385520 RepID=A0A0A0JHA6_9MICO|nr:hypothetical protein [Knoellia sinensis]KGN34991.1 hypothetical protein N802_00700 [Knoellia sinensis KCTC 19936]
MKSRLALLTGQTIALGVMVAFLVVPASALFLARYGADALPFTYLAVAVTGVVVTILIRRAQNHFSLARLAVLVLTTYIAIVAVAWALLEFADAVWVTFPLIVVFPLIIPLGLMLVGAQSGRLLDVRQIKAHLPRVMGGFALGFAIGGVGAAALVGPLGGPVPLLGVDALTGVVLLGLTLETARRFPGELRATPDPLPPDVLSRPALRTLLGNRLVLVVFGYQVLAAATMQLLDFLVWERAAVRYPDPTDLTRFQGLYGAVINVTAILFVVLLAGRLLTRFGVGLGLALNPGAVVVLAAVGTALGFAAGSVTTAFFVLICVQQVISISLTDGMTRSSINATYQALPMAERLRAQTGVESAGVPVALGLVGGFLLLHRAWGLDILVVEGVTLVVALAWLALAQRAHREYRAGLRQQLARPPWVPASLRIRDEAQQAAVNRLLASSDPLDVQVAVTALNDTRHDWGWDLAPERSDPALDVRRALVAEAEHVALALDVLEGLDGAPGTQPLRSALRDTVTESARQATDVLALAHGRDEVLRAVSAMSSPAERERGLALEMLEVTCGHRTAGLALALVDPMLDDTARRRALAAQAPRAHRSTAEHLRDLVTDPKGTWNQPWLRACGLYAAPGVLGAKAHELAIPFVNDPDPVVAETARWVLRPE